MVVILATSTVGIRNSNRLDKAIKEVGTIAIIDYSELSNKRAPTAIYLEAKIGQKPQLHL